MNRLINFVLAMLAGLVLAYAFVRLPILVLFGLVALAAFNVGWNFLYPKD